MKLEEFLIGTKEDMHKSVDQIGTVEEANKHVLKWATYSGLEIFIGYAGIVAGQVFDMPEFSISGMALYADGIVRTFWSMGSVLKDMHFQTRNIPRPKNEESLIEHKRTKLKTILKPGIVGLTKSCFNKWYGGK